MNQALRSGQSHQVLLLSVLQSYTSVIIPTSVCSQPNLVSCLITLSFSLLLGEHQTAVGPMTMIMRADYESQKCLI